MNCTRCRTPLKPAARFCGSCGAKIPAQPVCQPSGRLSLQTVLNGRYQIVQEIGRGGMGAVYLAQDQTFSSKSVVVKEMIPFYGNEQEEHYAHKRFIAEADTLALLSHPGIPQVYDRFLEHHRHYLVMEHIRGLDLQKTLDSYQQTYGRALPQDHVLEYMYSLTLILEYLHGMEQPVIHRDLKPANILLTREGRLKLVDFGIAKSAPGAQAGTKIGTQGYAAPEQFKGYVSPLSDIYSLGATVHHLLSGRDPQQEVPFDFPRLRSFNASISTEVEQLVQWMLAVSPQDRPPDIQTVRREITRVSPHVEKGALIGRHRDDEISRLITAATPDTSSRDFGTGQIFCPHCGTENYRESRFCRECGGRVPAV